MNIIGTKSMHDRAGKQIVLKSRMLLISSLCYLYLPLIIFFVTWLKWWIALLALIAVAYGFVRICSDFHYSSDVSVNPITLAVIVLMVLAIGWLCGWGGWTYQPGDWAKHNAILNDLVELSWPVYYKDAVTPSMLTYYIGQYLVPGLLGKLTSSFRVAEVVMYIWGEIGLLLIVFNLLRVVKASASRDQILMVVILVLFSGCLVLAQRVYGAVSGHISTDMHWMSSVNGSQLQYRSNFVDLRWVMPQCISVWLVITLWWEQRDKIEDYIPLMLPACLNGILSFLGLALIAVMNAVVHKICDRISFKKWMQQIFSLPNIVSALIPGSILLIYYSGNIFSEKEDVVGFSIQSLEILQYVIFVLAEFGIYCMFVWKDNKRNGLFLGSILLLAVLPWFSMGSFNDLNMSVSIPGMFIVMICVCQYLLKHRKTLVSGALVILLCIGAYYPIQEIGSVLSSYDAGVLQHEVSVSSMAELSNLQDEDISISWKYNYYTYDIEDSLFIEYFARETWDES